MDTMTKKNRKCEAGENERNLKDKCRKNLSPMSMAMRAAMNTKKKNRPPN
jgi:hypothetical protein